MSRRTYKRFLFVDSEKVNRDQSLQPDSMEFTLRLSGEQEMKNVIAMNLESFIVPSTFILFDNDDSVDNKIIISSTVCKPIVINNIQQNNCKDVTKHIQKNNIQLDISVPWYTIDDSNRSIIIRKVENISLSSEDIYDNTELNVLYNGLLLVLSLRPQVSSEMNIWIDKLITFSNHIEESNANSQVMNISISIMKTNIDIYTDDATEENAENIVDSIYTILNQITKETKDVMAQTRTREVVSLFTLKLKTGVYTKKSLLYEIHSQQMLISDPVVRNVSFQLVDDGTHTPYVELNVDDRDGDGDIDAYDIAAGPLLNENTTLNLINTTHEIQPLRKRFIHFEFKENSTTHKMKIPIPENENDIRLVREAMNRNYFFLNSDTESLPGDTTLEFRKQIEMVVDDVTNTTFFQRVPWASTGFEYSLDIVGTETLDDIVITFIGNYNIDEIEEHIQSNIRSLKELSFSIDRNTLKSSFVFSEDTECIQDLRVNIGRNVAKLLGYTELNSNFSYDICNRLFESQYGFNAVKYKYLYLCVDTNKARLNTIMNVYNSQNENELNKILGIIYLPEGPYGLNMMQHATLVGNNRVIFGSLSDLRGVEINTIHVYLRTPEGAIVNLNGQQIFFVLSFEIIG